MSQPQQPGQQIALTDWGYSRELDFDRLAGGAQEWVEGYRLVDQSALIGVPFAIVGITVRDGVLRDKAMTNYTSVECVVASKTRMAALITRGALNPATLMVDPNELVVFNDGSTGIQRQLIAFLHDRDMIDVGLSNPPRLSGAMGECDFDKYRGQWVRGGDEAAEGFKALPLLMVPRGLRVSEYTAEATNAMAETHYLA